MINISLPFTGDKDITSILNSLLHVLTEILRRAIDGTTLPFFIDYSNLRVLIGATAASAAPATMEIAGGNIKLVSGGKGVILPNSGATNYYLLTITEVTNDDGTIQPVLGLTKQ